MKNRILPVLVVLVLALVIALVFIKTKKGEAPTTPAVSQETMDSAPQTTGQEPQAAPNAEETTPKTQEQTDFANKFKQDMEAAKNK